MENFPRAHYMSTSHIAAFLPMALLPGLHTWNEFALNATWKISRRLLRGEYGKVVSPSSDTGGDIRDLLLLWPFSPSSNTHYSKKWTQLKGGKKIEPSIGILFSHNQLVYSSFSNMKCCWTFWIISLAFLSSRKFQS